MINRRSPFFISAIIFMLFISTNSFAIETRVASEKEKLAKEYLNIMGFENESRESYESLQMRITKSNPASGEKMKAPELTARYIQQLDQALVKTVTDVFSEDELRKTVALLKTSYGKTFAEGHRKFMKKYIENVNVVMGEIYKKGLAGNHE
ncbi:hypothetical protein [Pseudobdellovibrio exovorus]|uniref:Uncharacterized protein n=1 Tax=Pseudobdellovibrio exovorus JSS TaxID=1184267 RepID=M4V8C8_9BACT|nr:hypothetical protein [Pseudobdellovibrio exovorus]AGH94256.1 hypothetical protein A11Q_36 [Pseudobdellovibrio exovorus JSS]